jgi:ABC-type transport system involved in multi-copper enzyme maturation permease subunit
MSRVWAVALCTMREAVRDKLLYNLVAFALFLIGSTLVLSHLTLGEFDRLVLDVGLASINLFGAVIAIFVGVGLVNREIDRKTIYVVLSKTIPRWQFLLGKYLGLACTVAVNVAIMAVGLAGVLWLMEIPVRAALAGALVGICLELWVLTAMALLCSTFTTTTLSAICTLAVYVIGHSIGQLTALGAKLDTLGRTVLTTIAYVMPDLERFNLKGLVIEPHSLGSLDFFWILAYGLMYIGFLLTLATLVFQQRDFQ